MPDAVKDARVRRFCPLGVPAPRVLRRGADQAVETAATGELPPPGNDQVSIQCYNGPSDEDHWIRFENFCLKRLS